MSDPLQRGGVVLRGRRLPVVWDVRGLVEPGDPMGMLLLPVLSPDPLASGVPVRFFRHDVLLPLADLFAMGVSAPAPGQAPFQVRPVRSRPVPRAGHEVIGAVPPGTMCRVVHGCAAPSRRPKSS